MDHVIELARTGTAEALCEVYALFARDVYSAAYLVTGSVADANDVVQDVFLGLSEAVRRYDGKGDFHRWLNQLTVRVALSRLRRRHRRYEVPLLDNAFPVIPDEEDAIINRIELERVLEQLADHLRTVFVLKEIEGYSHDEIAQMLGISSRNAQVRLLRARRQIRRLLRVGR